MQRQTTIAKENEIQRKWYVIDATDKPLGRLASQVAQVLTGKNKPKLETKKYYNVSGYDGGLRTRTAKEMVEKYPEEMFRRCIHGMVPKGRLGRQIEKKLFVYSGADHKHEAQKPEVLELKY